MRKKKLIIRCRHEPNRLADTYLIDAYEKVIPTIKLQITTISSNEKCVENKKGTKLLKGNAK